jgi:hypothetical protein
MSLRCGGSSRRSWAACSRVRNRMRRVGSLNRRTEGARSSHSQSRHSGARSPAAAKRPVDRRIATAFDSLGLRDRIDKCPVDALELTIGQMSIEPAQLALVLLVSRLVCLLLKPAFRGVLPDPHRPVTKSVHAPSVTSALVVQLLCLFSVAGLSRLSDSFAVWRDEIYPPNRSRLCKCHTFSCDEHLQRVPGASACLGRPNEALPVVRLRGSWGHRSARDRACGVVHIRLSRHELWLELAFSASYLHALSHGARRERSTEPARSASVKTFGENLR